jgi:hypothetical protein
MERRPDRIDDPGVVAREQLQRDQRRPPAGRALIFQAAPQQLDLLPVAELADRAVGDCPLAIVGRTGGTLDLVLPTSAQTGERALVALVRQCGRLGSGCRQLRQLRASGTRGRCTAQTA